jgi:hypothetical protein
MDKAFRMPGEGLHPSMRKVLNIREGDPAKGVGKERVH